MADDMSKVIQQKEAKTIELTPDEIDIDMADANAKAKVRNPELKARDFHIREGSQVRSLHQSSSTN